LSLPTGAGLRAAPSGTTLAHAPRMPFTADTLAGLRAADPAGADAVVRGYHEPDDEGGGVFRWVPGADGPDDGGTVIASDRDDAGRWVRVFAGAADVHWYGARADGSNDTPAIQAALDANARVTLRPGRTYVLGQSTRHSHGSHPVCLVLNANQVLDGQGATLRMANGVSAMMLTNRAATLPVHGGPTRSIQLRNLEIDGNGFWRRPFAFRPTVYFSGPVGYEGDVSSVEDLVVENVRIRDSYANAFYADHLRRFTLRDLTVQNANGDGVRVFGSEALIDNVHVDTTHPLAGGAPTGVVGACQEYDLVNARIGRLSGANAWWGFKFQGSTRNVSIDSITYRGGDQTARGNRRGVKFQGEPGRPIRNVSVGSIEVTGARTNALYLIYVENLWVARYAGTGNGCAGDGANLMDCSDVLVLQEAGAVRFGEMTIERPAAVGLWVQGEGQHDLDFGRVRIAAPGIAAVAVRRTSARVHFEQLALQVANRPSDQAYVGVGDVGLLEVDEFTTDIPVPADRRALAAPPGAPVRIGRARFGSQPPRADVERSAARRLAGSAALGLRIERWATARRDVPVPGARPGDVAGAEVTPALPAGVVLAARVGAPGVVRVSLTNLGAAAVSVGGTLSAAAWRR